MGHKVIALKPHRYATERVVGEQYEMRASDYRLCKALGWISDAPQVTVAPVPVSPPIARAPVAAPVPESFLQHKAFYTRKDEVAAPAPTCEPEAESADGEMKPKRAYRRRDMTAETPNE